MYYFNSLIKIILLSLLIACRNAASIHFNKGLNFSETSNISEKFTKAVMKSPNFDKKGVYFSFSGSLEMSTRPMAGQVSNRNCTSTVDYPVTRSAAATMIHIKTL